MSITAIETTAREEGMLTMLQRQHTQSSQGETTLEEINQCCS